MSGSEHAGRLREALQQANIPTLLPILVQLTGDLRWLEEPYKPTRGRGLDDNQDGGLPVDVQQEIRAAAFDALSAWQAGRPVARPAPPDDLLVRMLSVSMGEDIPPEYGPMLADELAVISDEDNHRPVTPQAIADFEVLVIGAGVSGIAAAVRLGEAGIEYRIVEKRSEVGGTWLENRYPGCGVDTPSALYSFSFAPNQWSRYFALRDEIQDYLVRLVDDRGIRDAISFETEMISAQWREEDQRWQVDLRHADGTSETVEVNAIISAVGAFGRPKLPDIPGLETFPGPVAHTAQWPQDLDIDGRRVAVIGNGASAMQLVPAIAGKAQSLIIFQRAPHWAAPFEYFQRDVPTSVQWLAAEVPLYRVWYRLRCGWIFNDRIHPTLQKDPEWPHPERAVNAVNDGHRRAFTRYIQEQLGDHRELLPKVLPTYPPFGKRILLDNGWYRTLTRDDVELVNDRIVEIRGDRIVVGGGAEYEADVLVCATGFDVVRFLAPMDIRGRSGQSLREVWNDDDARAYIGLAVPDFPNFFMLFGPNTQAGHGGSLIGSAEAQLHYIVDLLRQMLEADLAVVDCRPDVFEDYNARVDKAHERMVWTHPGMDTYYRNSRGRVVVNTPFRVVDMYHMTRHANLGDYRTEKPRQLTAATLAHDGGDSDG